MGKTKSFRMIIFEEYDKWWSTSKEHRVSSFGSCHSHAGLWNQNTSSNDVCKYRQEREKTNSPGFAARIKTMQAPFRGSGDLFWILWTTHEYLGVGLRETPGAAGIWEPELPSSSAAGAFHTTSFPHKWARKPRWWEATTGRFSFAFWSKPHSPCSPHWTYTTTFSKTLPLVGFTFQEPSSTAGFSRSDGSRSSGGEHPYSQAGEKLSLTALFTFGGGKKKLQTMNKRFQKTLFFLLVNTQKFS